MSDSDNLLDNLVSSLNKWSAHQASRQNSAEKNNKSSDNWWSKTKTTSEMEFEAQLKAIVESAVAGALAVQKQSFEKQLQEMNERIGKLTVNTPEVETYVDAEIRPGVVCSEPLDIIKSLPDFDGKSETYVSWRKAAHVAFKVFKDYEGSSTFYQALGIMRNKIKGPANTVLASFNTPLHFKAMISRLDFTYSDKRPIYLIEQELSTLRQGDMTLTEFYDEVEKKLTLLTNKTIMTFDSALAMSLNEKYRTDALRVFVTGAKKSLSDILFAKGPKDLPTALALAQEVESNHERYQFALIYSKNIGDRGQKIEQRHSDKDRNSIMPMQTKNPYFSKRQVHTYDNQERQDPVQLTNPDVSMRSRRTGNFGQTPFPTQGNIWPSQQQNSWPSQQQYSWPSQQQNSFRTQNQFASQPQQQNTSQAQGHFGYAQASKRPTSGSARFTGPKQQRINYLPHEKGQCEEDTDGYQKEAEAEVDDYEDELVNYDHVHFLATNPCYRT